MNKNLLRNLLLAFLAVTLFFLALESVQRIRYWRRYDSTYWLRYGFAARMDPLDYYKMQLKGLFGIKEGGIVRIPRIFYDGYSKFDPAYPNPDGTINSLGFRNREFKPAKPAGTYRIAVVGDSTVFGLGSGDSLTFPVFLERALRERYPSREIEVINFGIPSYTSEEMANLVRSEILGYSPDMIIVYGFFNDIYYSDVVFRKDRYLLTLINSFLLDHSVFYLSLREKLCRLMRKDIGELYRGSVETITENLMKDDSILARYRRNMGKIITAAKGRGTAVVIVKQAAYLTDAKLRKGVMTSREMEPFYKKFCSAIDEIGKEYRIVVIGANEEFDRLPGEGDYFLEGDGIHLTPEGNCFLADVIFKGIRGYLDIDMEKVKEVRT